MINTSITEDRIMDTTNESSPERLEADRTIIRQSLDQIAAEVGVALRGAGLGYPVYMSVPNSGDALGMIITPVDPSDDDWEKVVAIFSKIIRERLGEIGLRSRDLPCAAVTIAISGAEVIAG
jgi:hypothetical protein